MPQWYRKTLGWLSRWQDVSVNSRVLKVANNVLPVYLGNIIYPSGDFDGVEEFIVTVIVFLSNDRRLSRYKYCNCNSCLIPALLYVILLC